MALRVCHLLFILVVVRTINGTTVFPSQWIWRNSFPPDPESRDVSSKLFADESENLYWTDGGNIFATTNTINWRKVGEAPALTRYSAVAHGNGRFVAQEYNYGAPPSTSLDGYAWTKGAPENAKNYRVELYFGNGVFVSSLLNGTDLLVSTNGEDWRAVSTGLDPDHLRIGSLSFNDGVFVAGVWVRSPLEWPLLRHVAKSTNGVDWSISPQVQVPMHVSRLMNLQGRLFGMNIMVGALRGWSSFGFLNDDLSNVAAISLPSVDFLFSGSLKSWNNTLVISSGPKLLQSDPFLEMKVLPGAVQTIELDGLTSGADYEIMWSETLHAPWVLLREFTAKNPNEAFPLTSNRSGFFWIRTR